MCTVFLFLSPPLPPPPLLPPPPPSLSLPAPGKVEGITTRRLSDPTILVVSIPEQPLEVARGVIERYTVTVERYARGGLQRMVVVANETILEATFRDLSEQARPLCT